MSLRNDIRGFKEFHILNTLSSPIKIQNFLDTLKINFEKGGDTLRSPLYVLKHKEAHCIEAALVAAVALWMHGEEPLLLDMRAVKDDFDHVLALYKKGGRWGALSKSNHATIRYRDPVYLTPRELALSYFHEYTENKKGKKTFRAYSRPFNLKKFGTQWITSPENLWHIAEALDDSPHYRIIPHGNERHLRRADHMELRAGRLIEYHDRS